MRLELHSWRERFFWPALLMSVVLHGVVLGLLLTYRFASLPQVAAPRAYVEVSFIKRVPKPAAVPEFEQLQEESTVSVPFTAPLPGQQNFIADDALDSRVRAHDNASQARALPPSTLPLSTSPPSTPAPQAAPREAEVMDLAVLQAQIRSFTLDQREGYTKDFVDDCWIERKEDARRTCTGVAETDKGGDAKARTQVAALFQNLTRNERHAQMTAQLDARDTELQALQTAGGVVGALAAERRSINGEYRAYLNGNQNASTSRFVQSAYGNIGNPQVMGSFLQFICKKGPCIYEFTGFSVVKPPALEPATEEYRFPYTLTPLGSRK